MMSNPIKCPSCGKEVEFVRTASVQNCPDCGSALTTARPSVKVNWWIFLAVLLAPAALAHLAALGKVEGLAVFSPVVGGPIAGILCGIQLAQCIGRTGAARLGLGLLFAAAFACVSFGLGFAGCLLGGYRVNF